MDQISAIEKRLWASADTLRANSNFASNEYFLPVMGLIFLRHAYSRYFSAKAEIEPTLPKRGGQTRPLTKEDFSGRGAIFLRPKAQFDYLASLPDSSDRAKAIIDAMEAIEKDYASLAGTLPKGEYTDLDNDVLGNLLRVFNDPALQKANGDVFGRIYEYFLTQFADQKAHDGGEFFTPISIVQLIVNVIEPDHGTVLDPACGSGGMFVQSAHFIEQLKKDPTKLATFYGMEKNPTTIRLAKMNLAVHGLEGRINKAISYYEDPHELVGKADFVMANPPFNVDEIDADKIRRDPRLPYGLPGVNKGGKVSNGNYVWISYFDAYLNARGRAGFVMSSQASSSGGEEARVRRDLIKSGHVDAMISIRGNFFYTRSVPCELWFLNKAKPKTNQSKVLMLDARGVYRKLTRKIFDFSPEQLANLTSIIWLYRGNNEKFVGLVEQHLEAAVVAAQRGLGAVDLFAKSVEYVRVTTASFFDNRSSANHNEFTHAVAELKSNSKSLASAVLRTAKTWTMSKRDNESLKKCSIIIDEVAERAHDLGKQIDHLSKLFARTIQVAEVELNSHEDDGWDGRAARAASKSLDEPRTEAISNLNLVRYFVRHARWLQERFPEAKLRNVEGLVKLVSPKDMENHDWSLSPGRYVGTPELVEDEEFDFEDTMRDIHNSLSDLNSEAADLSATIIRNFEALGL